MDSDLCPRKESSATVRGTYDPGAGQVTAFPCRHPSMARGAHFCRKCGHIIELLHASVPFRSQEEEGRPAGRPQAPAL